MKKSLYISVVAILNCMMVGLVSCDDFFDLRPQSETVLEAFWGSESDVASAVGACYRGMNQSEFLKRMIVWGEVRSDNVVAGGNIMFPDGDAYALIRILYLSLTADNAYTDWGVVYNVINNCNNVIHFAPLVGEKDPNFTQSQLNSYMAEAVGIRALCYFTLLRTFRNIPLILEPTISDSKSFEVEQALPDSVINFLIKDLKGVENKAKKDFKSFGAEEDKGRITQKAIWALLADIYLWKNDYENCINYCDKILNDQDYRADLGLEPSASFHKTVFVDGNSREGIFELQFNAVNIINTAVYKLYSRDNFFGLPVSFLLSSYDFLEKEKGTLFAATDNRSKYFAFLKAQESGCFPILKYVYLPNTPNPTQFARNHESTAYIGNGSRNWIFYRLPDIYLMKAEALVEKDDENWGEAYDWVKLSYNRANPDGELPIVNSREEMRELVFNERQREFLFEGKRYFDLLRRIEREKSPTFVVNKFMMKKYAQLDWATVRTKLFDMDALYMPINKTELKLNPILKQNPFYVDSQDIVKK